MHTFAGHNQIIRTQLCKQNATTEEEKEQEKYLVAATFFILLGALLYLPLGNSNLIIEN